MRRGARGWRAASPCRLGVRGRLDTVQAAAYAEPMGQKNSFMCVGPPQASNPVGLTCFNESLLEHP